MSQEKRKEKTNEKKKEKKVKNQIFHQQSKTFFWQLDSLLRGYTFLYDWYKRSIKNKVLEHSHFKIHENIQRVYTSYIVTKGIIITWGMYIPSPPLESKWHSFHRNPLVKKRCPPPTYTSLKCYVSRKASKFFLFLIVVLLLRLLDLSINISIFVLLVSIVLLLKVMSLFKKEKQQKKTLFGSAISHKFESIER